MTEFQLEHDQKKLHRRTLTLEHNRKFTSRTLTIEHDQNNIKYG